ncbi:hypothetical protein SCHPADRAFT_745098 [Schizopora paradoxa]|uniref:Uncharacterized protein n=1 Tax=Schizopora paradoxa TaxID=27342 RepID=A0A0H2R0J8_9AGAM|nr:hypothetical protein SCHPADRAFT_745098 [Schizopora paradoxa]
MSFIIARVSPYKLEFWHVVVEVVHDRVFQIARRNCRRSLLCCKRAGSTPISSNDVDGIYRQLASCPLVFGSTESQQVTMRSTVHILDTFGRDVCRAPRARAHPPHFISSPCSLYVPAHRSRLPYMTTAEIEAGRAAKTLINTFMRSARLLLVLVDRAYGRRVSAGADVLAQKGLPFPTRLHLPNPPCS